MCVKWLNHELMKVRFFSSQVTLVRLHQTPFTTCWSHLHYRSSICDACSSFRWFCTLFWSVSSVSEWVVLLSLQWLVESVEAAETSSLMRAEVSGVTMMGLCSALCRVFLQDVCVLMRSICVHRPLTIAMAFCWNANRPFSLWCWWKSRMFWCRAEAAVCCWLSHSCASFVSHSFVCVQRGACFLTACIWISSPL